MNKQLASALILAASLAAPGAALAHGSDLRVGIHLGIPLFVPPPPRVVYYPPRPVYYAPPAYYYAPPRVVYRGRPVHHHHHHHHRAPEGPYRWKDD